LFVFVFFSFTPALKALVSAKISIFPLKIRVQSSFVIYMVHDYSYFGSTADFVIKKEHLGFLPDLVISKRQRRRIEIWP
jgi:uncharacterized protein with ParB-like and HNH nuclease domain